MHGSDPSLIHSRWNTFCLSRMRGDPQPLSDQVVLERLSRMRVILHAVGSGYHP